MFRGCLLPEEHPAKRTWNPRPSTRPGLSKGSKTRPMVFTELEGQPGAQREQASAAASKLPMGQMPEV